MVWKIHALIHTMTTLATFGKPYASEEKISKSDNATAPGNGKSKIMYAYTIRCTLS